MSYFVSFLSEAEDIFLPSYLQDFSLLNVKFKGSIHVKVQRFKFKPRKSSVQQKKKKSLSESAQKKYKY